MGKASGILTVALSALCLAVLAALAIRGMVDPRAAAESFGVPAGDASAEFYQAVYRSRNLMLATTGASFLALSMWRALAILFTASTALPLYDIFALAHANVPVAAVHTVTLGTLALLSGLLWVRARDTPVGPRV